MADENDPRLPMFEAMARSQGPEVALRQCSQVFGEAEGLKLLHAYERKVGIISTLSRSPTLRGEKRFVDWYSGPSEDDRFWPALKKYLLEMKKWPPATVESLDRESTNVMRLLPHVGGKVDTKGLVIGYVQSGKTANYSALIAKAADVGYRLIIVLAGIHNSLRRQTQTRLQAELIDGDERVKTLWHTLTLPHEDFRAGGTNTDAFLSSDSHQRILLVVKKNAHVLKRLVKWLSAAQPRLLEMCPALLIDDEADQAGLNTGKLGQEDDRTAINRLILALKKALPKSAYVGYTATPFANVLTDPSGADLYPSDFIIALTKPPNYFGAELFFGREPLENEDVEPAAPPDMFREVEEDEVPNLRPSKPADAEGFAAQVPASLRTAVEYFILATAARWARGHRMKHSSMLVHTSMNLPVHRSLAACIAGEVLRIRKALPDRAMNAHFEQLWTTEHARVTRAELRPVPFSEVQPRIGEVLARLRVVVDNSKSESRLIYKEEETLDEADEVVHIAVGGNTLSRGLTLEGLLVSYFVRSASAYDTLLQMGRWFGYRFGYEDLPRIWMTEDLRQAFRDLATVEEEIRADVARYEDEGLTPLQFAVRIRTHPTLAVTSRLKMQAAVPVQIDYAGFTRQTTYFHHRDAAWLDKNWRAGASLVDALLAQGKTFEASGPHRFVKGVAAEQILSFLDSYECHDDHTEMRRELLRKYIAKQKERGRLGQWTVAAVTLTNKPAIARLGGIDIAPVGRSMLQHRGDGADVGTITTQDNFSFDLPPEKRPKRVEGAPRIQHSRPADEEPLLLLIPINKDSIPKTTETTRKPLEAARHVLGIALAFPNLSIAGRLPEDYIQVQLPISQPSLDYYDDDDEGGGSPMEDDG